MLKQIAEAVEADADVLVWFDGKVGRVIIVTVDDAPLTVDVEDDVTGDGTYYVAADDVIEWEVAA